MRKSLVLASMLVLCCSAAAFAGVPDPARSGCEAVGNANSCQFNFRCDGGLDILTLCVTVRDAFDTPVASCSVSAGFAGHAPKLIGTAPNDQASAFCSPCPTGSFGGVTDAGGVVKLAMLASVGGRGIGTIGITAHCVGQIELNPCTFHYSSPDLDGSCDVGPPSTGVLDLALWGGCLPPGGVYCESSDYTCDGSVGVLDIAIFGGGLTLDCSSPVCP